MSVVDLPSVALPCPLHGHAPSIVFNGDEWRFWCGSACRVAATVAGDRKQRALTAWNEAAQSVARIIVPAPSAGTSNAEVRP